MQVRAVTFSKVDFKSAHFIVNARLPPRRIGFNPRPGHRIFASGNRAGRCRWSTGFLGDLPFPPRLHYDADSYSLQSPSSALKTSLLRAAQITSPTHSQTTKHACVCVFSGMEVVGGKTETSRTCVSAVVNIGYSLLACLECIYNEFGPQSANNTKIKQRPSIANYSSTLASNMASFTSQNLVTYSPAGNPANREYSSAYGSQSEARPVPRAARSQLQNGYVSIKVTDTPFLQKSLSYLTGSLIDTVQHRHGATSTRCNIDTAPIEVADLRNTLRLLPLPTRPDMYNLPGGGGRGEVSWLWSHSPPHPLHIVLGYCHYLTLAPPSLLWRKRRYDRGGSSSAEVLIFSAFQRYLGGRRGDVVVRLLAFHQREPGSIPVGTSPGSSHSGNRAGRCRWPAGFLGVLPFPPPLYSNAAQLHVFSTHNYFTTVDQEEGGGDMKTTNLRLRWSDDGIQCWRIREYPEETHLPGAYTSRFYLGKMWLRPRRESNPDHLGARLTWKIREFNDLQARLYSLMYRYADVNCALVVCCHSGRRRLGQRSPGGVKHR
ncbi:hypothetical protein PR048_018828, partial [Dryococelus australis]